MAPDRAPGPLPVLGLRTRMDSCRAATPGGFGYEFFRRQVGMLPMTPHVHFASFVLASLAFVGSTSAQDRAALESTPELTLPVTLEGFVFTPEGLPAEGAVVVTSAGGSASADASARRCTPRGSSPAPGTGWWAASRGGTAAAGRRSVRESPVAPWSFTTTAVDRVCSSEAASPRWEASRPCASRAGTDPPGRPSVAG